MVNMLMDSMDIDFMEKVGGSKLPKTLAMTVFAPTGGGVNPSVERVYALLSA